MSFVTNMLAGPVGFARNGNLCYHYGCTGLAVASIEGRGYCGTHHYGIHVPTARWIEHLYFRLGLT